MTERRQPGMTLVELIVAMTVTVLVTGATVPILRGVSAGRQRTDAQMSMQQEARAALHAITTALRNAARTEDPLPGLSGPLEGIDSWQGEMPCDRIRFYTISGRPVRPDQPESDLRECEFFLAQADQNELPSLARRLDPTRNDPPRGGGVLQRIAGNVVGLDFSYFDGVQWLDSWGLSQQGRPVAIRVRLIVATDATLSQTWTVSEVVNWPCLPAEQPGGTAGQGQGSAGMSGTGDSSKSPAPAPSAGGGR